ncbi:Farnesyltransferase beta subunit [Nesidiocoris tenuis]|uniref:Protein farnesyltransferase subunit beta n=1 Tax=Nesidiocoris tenuis TaxID=355587 RepID=A0ABN7ARR9_9HEMI|nr:Farnesyltransferase beta subunit [Nesidiocoris tenuis]
MEADSGSQETERSVGRERHDNEGIPTASSFAQEQVEEHVAQIFKSYELWSGLDTEVEFPLLRTAEHRKFLSASLSGLPESFGKLDSSQTWLCYWILHSLALLDSRIDDRLRDAVVVKLTNSIDKESGGYGGGPYQYGHLAPTYAAINSLVIIGSPTVWSSVDREGLKKFLYKVRVGDGSFVVHEGGESDIRAVYCAVVVAKILNIDSADLFDGTVEWIVRCQTYEGGFGGDPGQEAHGGYSFCAIAALYLLNALHMCDLKALMRWTVNRQMPFEGGFQGRTNKLVDSCYSFWQGATVVIAQLGLSGRESLELDTGKKDWIFNKELLQEYVLMCCQDEYGGFMDKPHVRRDPYHTCYALSGLSLAQSCREHIVGDVHKNAVKQIHPAFNLPLKKLTEAMDFFYGSTTK